MDPLQGDKSTAHMKPLPNITITDISDKEQTIILGTNNVLEKVSSFSSSTSSDDSSEEDFFQLDPRELNKSIEGNNVMQDLVLEDTQLAFETRPQDGRPTCANGVPNLLDDGSLISGPQTVCRPLTSDVSVTTPASDTSGIIELTQSPPVQMMVRSDVPDPNRIPSSVFARTNTTTPMEWSTASNESLFSIHMGNSSFSRDHIIFMNKSGDMSSYSSSPIDIYPPVPPLSPTNPFIEDVDQPGLYQSHAAETMNLSANANSNRDPNGNRDHNQNVNTDFTKDALTAHLERDSDKDLNSAPGVRLTPSMSQQSDGSTSSFRSFAFPILTGDGRNASVQVETEHQDHIEKPEKSDQPSPQIGATETAPSAATGNRWFPCFSCPFCC